MGAVQRVEQTDAKEHPVIKLFTSGEAMQYIAPFLPADTDPRRVAATVLLAIKNDKSGKLAQCTPRSLVLGVARILQWGLELGVTAHLLPFKDKDSGDMEATPVADYKGLAELMIGSGAVRHVEAHVVYDGDEFSYRLGLDPKIDHVPAMDRTQRGTITFAYCIVHLPFGRFAFDVMSAQDIDAIRQQYSKQWKGGVLPAWYAKKTVVRQVAKLIPKNPRLAKVLSVMDADRAIEVDTDALPGLRSHVSIRDEEDEMVIQDAQPKRMQSGTGLSDKQQILNGTTPGNAYDLDQRDVSDDESGEFEPDF